MNRSTQPTDTATPPPVGRYAPSPTGELHFGSLVAALASFLEARQAGGLWKLRIEDIDPPREVPGAAEALLEALCAHGLHWDGPVLYQSERLHAYAQAITKLRQENRVFDCACTRKQARSGPEGLEGPIYPGTCRAGLAPGVAPRSLRLRVDAGQRTFTDRLQGRISQHLKNDVGDFVLRRADGYYAYQLASVVDDAYQGITDVVRGADLLTSTPRQIYLFECLHTAPPSYCHIPLVLDAGGEKLSKHSQAPPLENARAGTSLYRALEFLGQHPPRELQTESPSAVLEWAVQHWCLHKVPGSNRTVTE